MNNSEIEKRRQEIFREKNKLDDELRQLNIEKAKNKGYEIGKIIKDDVNKFIVSSISRYAIYGRRIKKDGTPHKREMFLTVV
jgi:hypothetical protein